MFAGSLPLRKLSPPSSTMDACPGARREFPKLGLPYLGVLIMRILLFRVLYWGPLFSETPTTEEGYIRVR